MSAKLTADSINRQLSAAGLPNAIVLEVAAESTDGHSVAVTVASKRQVHTVGILSGLVGASVLVTVMVGAFLFRRRTRRRKVALSNTNVASVQVVHVLPLRVSSDGACPCSPQHLH